jgi:stage III sporulation protein AA
MDNLDRAALLLPPDMRGAAAKATEAEEFRLRTGFCPTFLCGGSETELAGCRAVSADDLDGVLERATAASVHTAQSSIKNGFVTVAGGIRIGICGSVIASDGRIQGMKRLSGASIRIPREVNSCADSTYAAVTSGGFKSTVIISPPGGGKTTYLRELIRRLSETGLRVGLADERGEVAAVWDGKAQFGVGSHTDVMTDAPKAVAAVMLLRSMNPRILAMDEITAPEDTVAALEAVGCGVELLCTAHAGSVDDFYARPLYRQLVRGRVFRRAVIIGFRQGRRVYSVEDLT